MCLWGFHSMPWQGSRGSLYKSWVPQSLCPWSRRVDSLKAQRIPNVASKVGQFGRDGRGFSLHQEIILQHLLVQKDTCRKPWKAQEINRRLRKPLDTCVGLPGGFTSRSVWLQEDPQETAKKNTLNELFPVAFPVAKPFDPGKPWETRGFVGHEALEALEVSEEPASSSSGARAERGGCGGVREVGSKRISPEFDHLGTGQNRFG